MKNTTQGQSQMFQKAQQRLFDACRTFNEIMTGPSPLTKEEIKKLIEKRPEVWGIFRCWVER